jgi:ribonuclease HI
MSKLKEVTIYTDGSCIRNPGPGGYGVILCYGNYMKQLSGGFRLTTSNRMEIMAAIAGLEALKAACSVTLYSDSKYLVNAMMEGWTHRWKANNWWRSETERVLNADLWDRLLLLCTQHTVNFVWVRGHAGCLWNEQCHALSRRAANRKSLPVDKEYEQDKGQPHNASQPNTENLISNTNSAPAHIGTLHTQPGYQEKPKEGLPKEPKAETPGIYQKLLKFDGRSYIWGGDAWYDANTFLKPPEVLIHKLNALLVPGLEQEDKKIRDIGQLLKRAREARDSLQHGRAEKLARRVIKISPGHLGALAILSSCLRARGLAQQALDETEAFKGEKYCPLLTSRAAALCDVGRWEEARKVIGRVLAIGTDKDTALNVVNRIKNARPDLYS